MTHVHAIFKRGAFVPTQPCDLPEGSEVDLTVHTVGNGNPTDEQRRQHIAAAISGMKANAIQGDPPRWTRDELHDRR